MKKSRRLLGAAAAALLLLSPAQSADRQTVDPKLVMALILAVKDAPDTSVQMETAAWLAGMSKQLDSRVPDPFYRIDLLKTVNNEAQGAGLSPELVLAVIEVESQFDRFAVSRSGARGLMQVMPFWIKEIGHPQDDLFHPRTNLRYGCTILKYYLDLTDGDVREALVRYNGGAEKEAYATRVMAAFNQTWQPSLSRVINE